MSRASRAAIAAGLLAALLTSCPSRTTGVGGGAPADPPRRGGTLRMLLSEDPDALDPQRATTPEAWGLLRGMHRGLMAFPAAASPKGAAPVPDLAAAAPEVSADGLVYTFRLRGDAAFGAPASRPVAAADVKAGLERIFTARSELSRYYTIIAGAGSFAARRAASISGIATPDAQTVVITLARPVNDLLWLLALPAASAVPPGLASIVAPTEISPSGPYRLADGDGYVAERRIRLVRNAAWNGTSDPVRGAWVDEIDVEIGVAPAEGTRMVLDGGADLSGEPPANTPVPDERLVRGANGCLRYLFLNTRVSPFTSRRVRAAVASAVDRQAIAAIEGAGAIPATTILPPAVSGHTPPAPSPSPSPDAARAALARAGRPDGFATRLVVGDLPNDRAESIAIASALRNAGVRVTVRTVPIASLHEDRYEVPAARVPMGLATWCADWPGLGGRGALAPLVDGRGIRPRGNTNYSGLADRSLHALLDAASREPDPAAAADRWTAADVTAVGHSAVVPLAFRVQTSVLGPDVRGFVSHPYFTAGDLTAVWLDR